MGGTALGAKPLSETGALQPAVPTVPRERTISQKQSRELHERDSGFSSIPATETFLVCNTTLFKHATISSPLSSQTAVILCLNLGVDCEGLFIYLFTEHNMICNPTFNLLSHLHLSGRNYLAVSYSAQPPHS